MLNLLGWKLTWLEASTNAWKRRRHRRYLSRLANLERLTAILARIHGGSALACEEAAPWVRGLAERLRIAEGADGAKAGPRASWRAFDGARPRQRLSRAPGRAGIPKFYRWLSERYPLLNQKLTMTEGPPEIDNLYLDMNGIIHNCTHANRKDTGGVSEIDMMLKVFDYLDKLVQIVRPQKLLFMAIDGAATGPGLVGRQPYRPGCSRLLGSVLQLCISEGHAFLQAWPRAPR